MSVDIRPELFDHDDVDWFFGSGNVPVFNVSGGTLGEMLSALGYVREDVDDAGFLPAPEVLRGITSVLEDGEPNSWLRERLGHLREVAEWAEAHERRVEWC